MNAPEKVAIAPFERETDSSYDCPAEACCPVQYTPGAPTAVVATEVGVPVAGTTVTPMVRVQVAPLYEIVTPAPVFAAAVPVFVSDKVPTVPLALNTAFVIDTLAVLPALPKIPNT